MTSALRNEINSEIVAAQLELIGDDPDAALLAARHLIRAWSGCMEIVAPGKREGRALRLVDGRDAP